MPAKQVLIAVDQLANTLVGGFADETISARMYRTRNPFRHVVDVLFFWDMTGRKRHCELSYESELLRRHLPKGYRK